MFSKSSTPARQMRTGVLLFLTGSDSMPDRCQAGSYDAENRVVLQKIKPKLTAFSLGPLSFAKSSFIS